MDVFKPNLFISVNLYSQVTNPPRAKTTFFEDSPDINSPDKNSSDNTSPDNNSPDKNSPKNIVLDLLAINHRLFALVY